MGTADLRHSYFRRSQRRPTIIRDEEAAGSNPVTPTTFSQFTASVGIHCGPEPAQVGGIGTVAFFEPGGGGRLWLWTLGGCAELEPPVHASTGRRSLGSGFRRR